MRARADGGMPVRLALSDPEAGPLTLCGGWLRVLAHALTERTLWLAVFAGFVLVGLAYQSPRSLFVDVGGSFDGPHTLGFYEPEQSGSANFRWSAGNSALAFPGVGRPLGPVTVRLQLSSGRSANSAPLDVAVDANGHPLPPLRLTGISEPYQVRVDPAWIGLDGDLRLDFTSPTFKSGVDKRELGFITDFVRVELPLGLTLPSATQLLWLLLSALLLYGLLRTVWVAPAASGVLTFAFLAGCAGVIAVQRLLLTVFTAQMALTLALALVVSLGGELVARRLARLAGRRGPRTVPESAWTGLRALVAAGVALKLGGVLYPHTFIIDAYFHLKYITYMSEGRPWEQFFGKNLSLAVMPKEEWGAARAFIPYSPFFYVMAAPLAKLPVPLASSVPLFSALFEALKVVAVFLLGLGLSTGRRAPVKALVAAAFYSAIPATFLLQQWGNWPTLLSLWLVTVWAALVALFWGKLTTLPVLLATTIVLALTMLSYTVTAAYTGLFVALLVVAGWLLAPRERKKWGAILLSLVVASLAAVLIFYGQYIGLMLQETLPTFGKALNEQGSLTTLRPTFGAFISGTILKAMQSYNLAIVYIVGFAGALWVLFKRGKGTDATYLAVAPSRRAVAPGLVAGRTGTAPAWPLWDWRKVWLGAWLLTFPAFTLLDYWVDQALKEFWFALPALAVVGGAWLLTMGTRARWSRTCAWLVWVLWGVLVWQSLSLWVFRLLFHNR